MMIIIKCKYFTGYTFIKVRFAFINSPPPQKMWLKWSLRENTYKLQFNDYVTVFRAAPAVLVRLLLIYIWLAYNVTHNKQCCLNILATEHE